MSTKAIKTNNYFSIILFLIFIAGVVLRFKGLTFQSHWLDELFSVEMSDPGNSFSTMYDTVVHDMHPPLYQSILWVWYHLFGFTEFAGRSLSAVIGSLSVLAVYILGKEFYNKETGIYAAIIASLNPFLIYYSQEVRSYSLLFLLSTISYVYFLRVLKSSSKKNFSLYLITTTALLYTHYFSFFLVATQACVFVFYAIDNKENRTRLIILAAISAFVFVVSLVPLLQHILSHEAITSFWIKPPSNWFFLDYMKAYVKSQYLMSVFLALMMMVMIFFVIDKDNKNDRNMFIVLALWIILGYLFPYVRSVTAIPMLIPRYTIIVVPAFIILISYGVFLLRYPVLKAAIIFIITFLSIHQLDNMSYYSKIVKDQYREVLMDVEQSKTSFQIYTIASHYIIYTDMLNIDLNILSEDKLRKDFIDNSLPNCFWVIDGHGDHVKKFELLNTETVNKVLEIKRYLAKAILYSYKTSAEKCVE